MPITLRPARADDDEFLYELYAGARAEEMVAWGWDTARREAFLSLQFRAQQAHYGEYPGPDHQIILNGGLNGGLNDGLNDGRPIGRLFISRLEDEIRLVDITLLPGHCNRGIGARMIRDLLDEAAQSGKAVRLHVEKTNRARRLYERLGFTQAGDTGSHFFMEWRAVKKEMGNDD
ncbi:MAG: GNAT family N-acetyltransferase [Blastocatellia bacterium]